MIEFINIVWWKKNTELRLATTTFLTLVHPLRNVTEKFVDDVLAAVKANILDTLTIEISKSIESLKESKILSRKTKSLKNELMRSRMK